MAASLLLVTSLSVTVYAAAELVQIRSKEGKVVLETKPEPEGSKELQAKQDRLYSLDTASRSSAFRSALPGQAIAYYIHNQEINELKREIHGKETLLEFHAGSLHLGILAYFGRKPRSAECLTSIFPPRYYMSIRFMKECFPLPPIFPICFKRENRRKLITIFKMS